MCQRYYIIYIARDIYCGLKVGEVEMMQNIWSWRRKAARENSLKQKRGINSFMLFKMDIGLLFKEAVRPGQTSDQRVMSKLYSTIWNWFKDGTECRNIFNFYQHLCDFGDSYENDLYISNFILQGASLTILVLEEMGIVQPNHDYQAFLKNVNSSVLGIKDFSPSDMERVRVSIESALPMQFEDLQVADTNVLFPDFNI